MDPRVALAIAELKRREALKIVPFKKQDAFVEDPSEFLSALCTRRAGKTNALARKFIKTMQKYPRSLCRYICLTRDSARDIMWPALEDLNERMQLNAELTESNLTMTLTNGSRLRLYGADMKNFVRRLRGAKSPANAIDEAQEFQSEHLKDLIDNILTPSMADYAEPWLAVTGTPGAIPMGLFYDITEGGEGGYSNHKWSIYENPYMPNAKSFVDRLIQRHKWTENHPTLLREWRGIWVKDLNSLLVKYDDALSHYEERPKANWVYILGVDIGLRDSDALAVIGWHEASQEIYLVEEIVTANQDITTLSEQINLVISKYNPAKIVMDQGGLGAKIAEEIRRRKHLPVHAADKKEKFQNVALLNDWLRLGKFKAQKTSRFAQDAMRVQIDWEKTTPDRIVVKKGFHSDIIDAILYAFKESPAYTYRAPVAKPRYGSKEWAEQEAQRMEEAAEEHFAQLDRELSGMVG